jgi:uncharacterized protein YggE
MSDVATRDAAARALAVAGGFELHQPKDVYDWNDSHDSPEPVLAAFDKAIAATAPAPPDPFGDGLPLSGNSAQHPGPKADIQKVLARRE